MQNQLTPYHSPLEWQLPSLVQTLHFEFTAPHTVDTCSLFLRDNSPHYFDLSLWQRDITVRPSAGNSGYTFDIIDYNRLMPAIKATGELIPRHHGSTQVFSDVEICYAGHLFVWGLIVFATVFFGINALTSGSLLAFGVLLVVNLLMLLALHRTMRRRKQMVIYIQESLLA